MWGDSFDVIVLSSASPDRVSALHRLQWGWGTVPSLWVQLLKNKHVYIPVMHTCSFFTSTLNKTTCTYIKTHTHADTPQATSRSNNQHCVLDCSKQEMFLRVCVSGLVLLTCHYDTSSWLLAWHCNSTMGVKFKLTLSQCTFPRGWSHPSVSSSWTVQLFSHVTTNRGDGCASISVSCCS